MKKDVLIYFDIITSLKTTEEINNLSLEIDDLQTSLFKSEKMSLDKAIDAISVTTGKKITEVFSKNNLDMNNKELVRDFLETLKDLIKKFKVIKLVISFDPTPKTIDNIHGFICENIGIGYILDIEIDESILGGAVVIFNGKYNDFSLRKSLDEVFTNKREDILQPIQ